MAALPVELIERILDYSVDDLTTMKECALVHSTFLGRCRIHLFGEVILHKHRTYFRFQDLVESKKHIAMLTTSLVIMDLENLEVETRPLPILRILDRLPNIRSLSVRSQYSGLFWNDALRLNEDALVSAVSRPWVTPVCFELSLRSNHLDMERLLRRCGCALRRLKLIFQADCLTRASFDDNAIKLESLTVSHPRIQPEGLIPRMLPLLDLSRLKFFNLPWMIGEPSYGWIKEIAKHASLTLRTLAYRPNSADLDDRIDLCPLSQFPALQHLRLDFEGRDVRFISYLSRISNSRSTNQGLKSLTIRCNYEPFIARYHDAFIYDMKIFLTSLTNVEHTALCIRIGTEELPDSQTSLWSEVSEEDIDRIPPLLPQFEGTQQRLVHALVRARLLGEKTGLEGHHPSGTLCTLTIETCGIHYE